MIDHDFHPLEAMDGARQAIAKAPSGGFSDPSEATGFGGVQEMENGLMNRMLLMAICEYLPSAMIYVLYFYLCFGWQVLVLSIFRGHGPMNLAEFSNILMIRMTTARMHQPTWSFGKIIVVIVLHTHRSSFFQICWHLNMHAEQFDRNSNLGCFSSNPLIDISTTSTIMLNPTPINGLWQNLRETMF